MTNGFDRLQQGLAALREGFLDVQRGKMLREDIANRKEDRSLRREAMDLDRQKYNLSAQGQAQDYELNKQRLGLQAQGQAQDYSIAQGNLALRQQDQNLQNQKAQALEQFAKEMEMEYGSRAGSAIRSGMGELWLNEMEKYQQAGMSAGVLQFAKQKFGELFSPDPAVRASAQRTVTLMVDQAGKMQMSFGAAKGFDTNKFLTEEYEKSLINQVGKSSIPEAVKLPISSFLPYLENMPESKDDIILLVKQINPTLTDNQVDILIPHLRQIKKTMDKHKGWLGFGDTNVTEAMGELKKLYPDGKLEIPGSESPRSLAEAKTGAIKQRMSQDATTSESSAKSELQKKLEQFGGKIVK